MRKLILVILFIAVNTLLFAQQVSTIKGKITGPKNEGLSGATVTYQAANKSTAADDNGNFVLEGLPAGQSVTLKFSSSGYVASEKSFNLTADGIADVSIILKLDALSLTDIVVTGVANSRSKLTSSVSVSTIRSEDISKLAPRTTAEIFRSIPGIKAEASGGDGNTNITVRGVPISSGGSKYLQLQEDGLPVLQFGDIALSIFVKVPSLEELEKRLKDRNTESAESLKTRIEKMKYESSFQDQFLRQLTF